MNASIDDIDIDWLGLERLRASYLDHGHTKRPPSLEPLADYWTDSRLLASYDATFAARIGWKWNAVLEELSGCSSMFFNSDTPSYLYDWGCGTGIATRQLLTAWGHQRFTGTYLFDRSQLAIQFASRQLEKLAANLRHAVWRPDDGFSQRPAILLVSHVLTELDSNALQGLARLAEAADAFIWVEPGIPRASASLIQIREQLSARMTVVAPCPHSEKCGLMTPENAQHWCHHFAKAPNAAFTSAGWRMFSERMGIDLRSLPVSFLAMEKKPSDSPQSSATTAPRRVIGRVRAYKAFLKFLGCDIGGVQEHTLQKRDNKELYKKMTKFNFKFMLPPDSLKK